MRGRLIIRLATMLLGTVYKEDEPRADMYLPLKLLAMGFVMILGAIALGTAFFFTMNIVLIVLAVVILLIGILAVICWKNQSIKIVSNEKFEYTTFLGNKHTYYFRDITDLRQNQDSITMFMGDKKVHIEGMAIMSDRLVDLINSALNPESTEQ